MVDALYPRAVIEGSLVGPPGKDGAPGPNAIPTIDAVTEYLETDTTARDAVDARVLDGLPQFDPDAYGASNNPATDNRSSLQAALDAAAATGGGIVQLRKGRRYGWKGALTVPNGVILAGAATRQNPAPDEAPSIAGLVALDAAAQLRVGTWSTGQAKPSGVVNVHVDGNYLGGNPAAVAKSGLVRIAGVNALVDNLFAVRSAGDGIVYDGLQNSTVVGGSSTLHVGCALVLDNGAGAVAFLGGYYGTSRGGVLRCRDTTGESNLYPFGPTHNTFTGTIFEAYPNITTTWPTAPLAEPFDRHVHVSGRAITFVNCNFTGGANNAEACTVLVDDTCSYVPATATFVSCLWWTRGSHDAVRVKGTASISFVGQQEVGDNGTDHPTSFLCVDAGFPHINMVGEVILAGDTNGTKIYRAINGGSLIGAFNYSDAGVVHRLRDVQSVGWRREGDVLNRFQVERDGIMRWFNGADGTSRATLQRATAGDGKGLVVGGRLYVGDALNVIAEGYSVTSANQTVTLDASMSAEHRLVFTNTGFNVTTMTITNAVDGDRMRVVLFGVGTNTVTWPANVEFAGTAPQPVSGKAVVVDIEYVAGTVNKWLEVARSGGGGGAGTITSVNGDSGPSVVLDAADIGAAPATHTHTASQVTGLAPVATSGSAADLTGTLPSSVLPPLAINEVFTVASQAAMLALTAQRGDMAVRTDTGRTLVLATDSASTLADWKEVQAAGQVTSVNGQTGVVSLPTYAAPSQAEAEAGTATTDRVWTAQRVGQAVKAQAPVKTDSGTLTIPQPPGSGEKTLKSTTGALSWVDGPVNGIDGAPGPAGDPGPIGNSVVATMSSGTLTLDPANATEYTITLAGNISLAAGGLIQGASIVLDLIQDGIGARTVTIPSDWIGADQVLLSSGANTMDTLVIRRNGAGYVVQKVFAGAMPSAFWTPNALSNRIAWWAADSIFGEDGDTVASWDNQWATSDFTAGGAPTLKVLNGRKYVSFDGVDDHMDATHSPGVNQPFVIAFVAKVPAAGPVISGPAGQSTAHDILITGSNWEMEPTSGLTRPNTGQWQTVVCQYIAGGNDKLRVDGVENASVNVNTLKVATYTRIGGEDGGAHNTMNMAELFKISGTVDSTTLAKIETYLNRVRDDLNGV